MLVSTAMLSTIFLLVGCSCGGSQAHKEHHADQSHSATLALHPEGDSGVSGTASFEDVPDGVVVRLWLLGLPKHHTPYLAHIHSGTCAGEAKKRRTMEEGTTSTENTSRKENITSAEEIEYPLSQVKTTSEGQGSSTTTLHHTSVDKLFSGGPKHVNVHRPGPGKAPPVACADLNEAR